MKIGTSQNNWPVYDETDHFVRFTVEGRGFWAANADVATVFKYWIQWFHDHIEDINLHVAEKPGFDDWSWNVRPIRGKSSGYSNHASATAVDLNATRHPRGVHNTYTGEQRKRMQVKLQTPLLNGVIRAGEFYEDIVDGMHFEINKPAQAVHAAALRIKELENNVTEKELTAAIVKVLKDEKIVKNEPTKAQAARGVKPATMTVVEALSNLERQGDGDSDDEAAFRTEMRASLIDLGRRLDKALSDAAAPPKS